jgi:rubrerythrin
MQEIMVPCKGCSNKVPASSLRMDIDIGKMVCTDCIKNKAIHKEIKEEIFHKKDADAAKEESAPSRIAHKCASCGYKFKIDPETKKPGNCPYCNARVTSF